MALNITTQDLDNYPGTTKTVTVDQEKIVPAGYEGDEQFLMSFSTSAYSDNVARTAIQDLYVMDFKTGWAKSSGFVGSGGKFAIDDTHKSLMIKMDNTTSGTDALGYYTVTLTPNDDQTPVSGEVIAADMEEAIRALTMETADTGYLLAYKNASVEFKDGKFWIVSGSIGKYYSGNYRSSVAVKAAASLDCSAELGFDRSMTSEGMDSIAVKEAPLAVDYTTSTTPLTIGAGTGVSAGDALMITDGGNTEYFTALAGTTDTEIVVPIMATNSFVGIVNGYTVASGTKVQILREQDPEGTPTMWHDAVDSICRYGVKTIINQIDYSS
ncbi:MAG: hypothetical protein DRP42_01470 [Tenericutes bacterium]|nr:MAG: hypothetical protein DRP42_01470 [Mycoplasmatota bacterium]